MRRQTLQGSASTGVKPRQIHRKRKWNPGQGTRKEKAGSDCLMGHGLQIFKMKSCRIGKKIRCWGPDIIK